MPDLTTSQILELIDQDQIFNENLLEQSELAYQEYLKDSKEYRESE